MLLFWKPFVFNGMTKVMSIIQNPSLYFSFYINSLLGSLNINTSSTPPHLHKWTSCEPERRVPDTANKNLVIEIEIPFDSGVSGDPGE